VGGGSWDALLGSVWCRVGGLWGGVWVGWVEGGSGCVGWWCDGGVGEGVVSLVVGVDFIY
jgi:hypothetical protein